MSVLLYKKLESDSKTKKQMQEIGTKKNTRLLIVLIPRGHRGLVNEQRSVYIIRRVVPLVHEISLSRVRYDQDVSTSRNQRGRRAWQTAGILAYTWSGAQRAEIKTKFDLGPGTSRETRGRMKQVEFDLARSAKINAKHDEDLPSQFASTWKYQCIQRKHLFFVLLLFLIRNYLITYEYK